ncbi:MAG: adenosylcobinamide-GDP ribazoletransferase [Candidatus Binatia bacterium]
MIALKFLTIFPWPKAFPTTPEEIGRSAAFFPVVGLCLGAVVVLFDRLLYLYLEATLLSIVLVTVMILLTRGFHLDGLGDTFDGLGTNGGSEEALKAMKDSRIGIFGLLAIVVVLAFKFHSVAVMESYLGLLVAPILSRWAMVVLAYGSQPAHAGLGQIMVENVRGRHLLFATLFTLAGVTVFAGRVGLWIAFWVSLVALLGRSYFHRRLGGVTGDTFGAVAEITEALSFVIFVSI